jgi:hypothetical protein
MMIRSAPSGNTGNYTARIVSVHQTGDVATAEVAEDATAAATTVSKVIKIVMARSESW